MLTSAPSDAMETMGGRQDSRKREDSRPSFSFNTQRSSGMERSRAASKDMVMVMSLKSMAGGAIYR